MHGPADCSVECVHNGKAWPFASHRRAGWG